MLAFSADHDLGRLVALLALCAAAALGSALTIPAVSDAKTCQESGGEGVIPTNLHATWNITCRTARKVSDKVGKVPSFGGCTDIKPGSNQVFIHVPCKRYGYSCRNGKRLA
jgi:hypothetical protein